MGKKKRLHDDGAGLGRDLADADLDVGVAAVRAIADRYTYFPLPSVGGRREAFLDLGRTALASFERVRSAEALIVDARRMHDQASEVSATRWERITELEARVAELEARVAREEHRFATLAAATARPRLPGEPATLADGDGARGMWLGAPPRWIDPGGTEVFEFRAPVDVVATHLAVPPLHGLAAMRIASINVGLTEYLMGGEVAAVLYAVRFPADAAEPVERGGALPGEIRTPVGAPIRVVARNTGDARELFECALYARLIVEPGVARPALDPFVMGEPRRPRARR